MKYGVTALMFIANSEIITLLALCIIMSMFIWDIRGALK